MECQIRCQGYLVLFFLAVIDKELWISCLTGLNSSFSLSSSPPVTLLWTVFQETSLSLLGPILVQAKTWKSSIRLGAPLRNGFIRPQKSHKGWPQLGSVQASTQGWSSVGCWKKQREWRRMWQEIIIRTEASRWSALRNIVKQGVPGKETGRDRKRGYYRRGALEQASQWARSWL